MKKLMLLGGIRYLFPVIEAAHKFGYFVITCDNVRSNPAHKLADASYNVSILDKDAVLQLAQELKIDGILSFGVDPGVVTAAYVAEKMGLPFQGSYEAVSILQDKARFRAFLRDNGFNVPNAKGYNRSDDAIKDVAFFNWPVIVKPVDSAGSKGVSKVEKAEDLEAAIEYALSESHCEQFVIEDFLEKTGCSSDSDCFSVDGEMKYISFSDQIFDEDAINPYVPAAYCWPCTMKPECQDDLCNQLQRLARLLNLKTGVYNIETRTCTNGKSYIMEFTPRGGGNRLSQMLEIITGTSLIDCAVRAAVNEPIGPVFQPVFNGYLAEIILHSNASGAFRALWIHEDIAKYVIEEDIWVNVGDEVTKFTGANQAIGTLVMRFENRADMDRVMRSYKSCISVLVD